MKMPWGRYKGSELAAIPADYLEWVRENLSLRPELAYEIDCLVRSGSQRIVDRGQPLSQQFRPVPSDDVGDFESGITKRGSWARQLVGETVERAVDRLQLPQADVRVQRGGPQLTVAQPTLDGANVDTGLQQMRSEAVTQCVRGHVFLQAGDLAGRAHAGLADRLTIDRLLRIDSRARGGSASAGGNRWPWHVYVRFRTECARHAPEQVDHFLTISSARSRCPRFAAGKQYRSPQESIRILWHEFCEV